MKQLMPMLSAFVIFFSALIVLFTPLHPQVSFIIPELKLVTTPVPSISPAPTSTEWQTYRNYEYGFEFQYPSTWKAEKNELSKGVSVYSLAEDGMESSYRVNFNFDESQPIPTKKSVEKVRQSIIDDPRAPGVMLPGMVETDLVIGGIKPIAVGNVGNEAGGSVSYHLVKNNKIKVVITISFDYFNNDPEEQQETYDKILSSFKFLPDTSTWKTYENAQYGFEFKYPNTYELEKNEVISTKDFFVAYLKDKSKKYPVMSGDSDYVQVLMVQYDKNFSCQKNTCSMSEPVKYGDNTFTPFSEGLDEGSNFLINKYYTVWISHNIESEKTIVNQILSTFKFTQ